MNYKIITPTQIPSMMETLSNNLIGNNPDADYRLSSLSVDRSSFVPSIYRVSAVITLLNVEDIDNKVKVVRFEWDTDVMILSCNGDYADRAYINAAEFLSGLVSLVEVTPKVIKTKFKH